MLCSVNDSDCVPSRLKRGMCEKHYRRWRRWGTTDRSIPLDNFSRYVELENGCWSWTGALWPNGYGKTSVSIHGTKLAHRVFYIEYVGQIPDGADLDHRCHNADPTCVRGVSCLHRRCVNPQHLEPVSRQVNLTRGINARMVCAQGLHDLSLPGAIRPGTCRGCTECWRIRYRKAGHLWRQKQRLTS